MRSDLAGDRSRAEAGGRRQEAGGRRQEAGGWRLEAGGWRLEAGGRRLEAGDRTRVEPERATHIEQLIGDKLLYFAGSTLVVVHYA